MPDWPRLAHALATINDMSANTRKLKYRFYFEEYRNQSNAYRVWWSTEVSPQVRKCSPPHLTSPYLTPPHPYPTLTSPLRCVHAKATNNEYNVPKSTADCLDPATNASLCRHVIRSQFKGRDMLSRGSGQSRQSVSQSVSHVSHVSQSRHSVSRSARKSISRWVGQSISQSVGRSGNQSVGRSVSR